MPRGKLQGRHPWPKSWGDSQLGDGLLITPPMTKPPARCCLLSCCIVSNEFSIIARRLSKIPFVDSGLTNRYRMGGLGSTMTVLCLLLLRFPMFPNHAFCSPRVFFSKDHIFPLAAFFLAGDVSSRNAIHPKRTAML